MFRRYSRTIAAVVLGFFTWTSGGVFSVANAAVDGVKKGKAQEQRQQKAEGAEERFSRLTEELTGTLVDPKATVAKKKERLKVAQGEIVALDADIRKQFAETEKRLKDAKLPDEILQRHYKFVKHYDDNLTEFTANLAAVEKAKDDKDVTAALEKARLHLEKVKAPSRHQPLDPNNLPHRQPKVIKREPRMKKEDFERDLKKDKNAWRNEKRIMVASTGSLAGLLASTTVNAVTPPTSADLVETIDAQLTPEIRAKAQELGNSPVKIYEWVRNNVEFVPTWGSIQGAHMTLLTKQGNAFDTASLLIALLRAAGIHARYVMGTIELPIDKVMNWAGGFSDPNAALDFMSSGGIPVTALTEGGKIAKARLEHVWVEAFINYIPFRGAKHVNGKGETWISLDPSYKQYNYPNATVGDVLGKKEIVKKEYPYLLGTLPYRGTIRGTAFTEIPDSLRHKLIFTVTNGAFDETPLAITKSLPELAGKKITLSYSPATPQDEALINSYLPKSHADGTPIQPSELPSSLPAYLINVKPELRVDGQIVATGSPVTLGAIENFNMTFFDPSTDNSVVANIITAGAYEAIGLNLGMISQDQLTNLKVKLESTKTKLQNNDFAGLTKDDLIGDLLYTTAISYHAELGTMNFITAKNMGVNAITLPSEAIFSTQLKVATMWGVPQSVGPGGLNMDADRLLSVVKAKDGNSDKVRKYMLVSGTASSELENTVPEHLFSTTDHLVEGISAVKALRLADNQGIPIYTIDQTNISTALSQLQLGQDVIADIQNAVNAGKVVTVSQTNVTYNGWTGCGYIIINPETGAGAYMISEGLSGAAILTLIDMYITFSAWSNAWENIYQYWVNLYNLRYSDTANPNDDCPLGVWSGVGGNVGGVIVSGGVFTGVYNVSCWSSYKACWIMATCGGTGLGLGGGISVESIWIDNARSISNLAGRSGYLTGFGGVGLIGVGGSASPGSSPTGSGGIGVGAGAGYLNGNCNTSLISCN